jgi:5-methylcytosine-specific restriction endonuclease McrA
MSDKLNKTLTLCLNAQWIPCEFKTGKQSIMSMCGGSPNHPLSVAISLDYGETEDGEPDYDNVINITTHKWADWVNLPVRKHDYFVKTLHSKIRIPTVIIHQNFNRNVLKRKKLSKTNILERDNWTCQYTGMKLTEKTATIDHILPRSKGGDTSWENCVAAHKSVNNKKGSKLNEEVGLKLNKKPVEPNPTLLYHELIEKSKYQLRIADWNYFLKNFEK